MACGCQKAKSEFIYTDAKGQQHTEATLVSARALKIKDEKAGKPGGSIREVAKK